jgi:hypothetical protein
MATGFLVLSLSPAAAVATNGTMTFTYPSGNASQFAQSGEKMIVSGLMNVLKQAADTFTLAYGGSSVVVTYKGATSIPAGTKVSIQLPLAKYAKVTDNSGGTASNTLAAISGTYSQTEVANSIATLAAKVNTLIDLSLARDGVPNDDRNG